MRLKFDEITTYIMFLIRKLFTSHKSFHQWSYSDHLGHMLRVGRGACVTFNVGEQEFLTHRMSKIKVLCEPVKQATTP
jgi:hypothetical protein